MSKIKIIIVDDNRPQNEGLERLFQSCESIDLIKIFQTPEECIERIIADRMIDIVLLDINFPNSNMDGIELAEKIRELKPFMIKNGKPSAPRIVFFSVKDGGFVDTENGIHGLIPKNADFDEIVQMIKGVHNYGGIPSSPNNDVEVNLSFWTNLTKTERKVFCLIMNGNSTSEIADELGIGSLTVDTHRKNILKKVKDSWDIISRIDDPRLVQLVVKHNLCKIDDLDLVK